MLPAWSDYPHPCGNSVTLQSGGKRKPGFCRNKCNDCYLHAWHLKYISSNNTEYFFIGPLQEASIYSYNVKRSNFYSTLTPNTAQSWYSSISSFKWTNVKWTNDWMNTRMRERMWFQHIRGNWSFSMSKMERQVKQHSISL